MPALLLAALLAPADTPADAAAPPNVVLILSDDQAWGDFGFTGHPHIATPHIDRLAAESLTFPHGYVPTSLCRPSLATLLTGMYPHRHGVTGNDPTPPGAERPPTFRNRTPEYLALRRAMNRELDDDPVLPSLFRDAGYRTLQTGKWWEGDPRDFGFTDAMTHGDLDRGGRHGDEGLTIGREGMKPIDRLFADSAESGRPFFLWYAPFLPHAPHNPPARLLSKYRPLTPHGPVAKYWAMCEWFDETVGDLRAGLDRHGLADDTVIAFVVDNGWINRTDNSRYAERSKRSPHEGGVRTPILLHRPGRIEPRTDDTPVGSIDLPRTLLTAAGLEVPAAVGGIDLLDPDAVASRGPVFGEIFEHDQPFPAPPAVGLKYRWVVDGDWKLIQPHEPRLPGEPVELYHLADDPAETRNLAAERPGKVAALRGTLDAWWDPGA